MSYAFEDTLLNVFQVCFLCIRQVWPGGQIDCEVDILTYDIFPLGVGVVLHLTHEHVEVPGGELQGLGLERVGVGGLQAGGEAALLVLGVAGLHLTLRHEVECHLAEGGQGVHELDGGRGAGRGVGFVEERFGDLAQLETGVEVLLALEPGGSAVQEQV